MRRVRVAYKKKFIKRRSASNLESDYSSLKWLLIGYTECLFSTVDMIGVFPLKTFTIFLPKIIVS